MGERLEGLHCELEAIYFNWEKSNREETGQALDEALEILETLKPELRTLIIETDGDELTDAEAMEMIAKIFNYEV